jgi:UDP-glucose 4-epimerase
MILVVGGNGYIGSQTNLFLLDKSLETVVLDKKSVPYLEKLPNWKHEYGELLDLESLRAVFSKYKFEGVIHFAASIEVGESQENPQKYYQNNVIGTLNLLQAMKEFDVKNIVFSSTAAVYGTPETVPIKETDIKNPINTYGRTKWMMEQILHDYHTAYGFNTVCLRYFNACGADLKSRTGENHDPESHLIPIILEVLKGKREFLKVYGNDYDTFDGTCIRDYIHTLDLAQAHYLAIQKLISGELTQEAINLGTKNGYSIMQIIEAAEKVTGQKLNYKIDKRRAGDPDKLIADNTKAKNLLGFEPKYSDLETIIDTAWRWEKAKTFLI